MGPPIKQRFISADELRDARIAIGLTQQEAADAVDVSKAAWSQWETGDRPVPEARMKAVRKLLKLAKAKP